MPVMVTVQPDDPADARDDVAARPFVPIEIQKASGLRLLEQVVERSEPVRRFAEAGPPALEGLLDHRSPQLGAVPAFGEDRLGGLHHQVEPLLGRIVLRRRLRFLPVLPGRGALGRGVGPRARLAPGTAAGRLALGHEVVVEDELVAVVHQEVGRGALDADADHRLRVLAELAHQRREVGVARHDDERVDVLLRVAEVEGVDDHPDVGRVLAGNPRVRDLDQLERRLVHRRLVFLVAFPVAVGLLGHDAALQQQPLDDGPDVDLLQLGVPDAEGDVLEVAEHREVAVAVHTVSFAFGGRVAAGGRDRLPRAAAGRPSPGPDARSYAAGGTRIAASSPRER